MPDGYWHLHNTESAGPVPPCWKTPHPYLRVSQLPKQGDLLASVALITLTDSVSQLGCDLKHPSQDLLPQAPDGDMQWAHKGAECSQLVLLPAPSVCTEEVPGPWQSHMEASQVPISSDKHAEGHSPGSRMGCLHWPALLFTEPQRARLTSQLHHRLPSRGELRHVGTPGRLVTWHLFMPMFFEYSSAFI